MTVTEALAAGGWSEMNALFARTGVVATLDDAPVSLPAPTDAQGRVLPAAAASEIAWRQAVPVQGADLDARRSEGLRRRRRQRCRCLCPPRSGEDPGRQGRGRSSPSTAFSTSSILIRRSVPCRSKPRRSPTARSPSPSICAAGRGRSTPPARARPPASPRRPPPRRRGSATSTTRRSRSASRSRSRSASWRSTA